ncbi:hypothetical protein R69658_06946 [Paraburkholderia aspalathi]|uniref:Uncharacterized protein n=1 Tax=Paraburkholderia aspalathi TaxID=1324617 RepID=A0ABN7N254_9BURK|nr:hypothetical protein R69658_06946 [Paraburkholderia aspalathi]
MKRANSRARAFLGVENCANGSRTLGPDQESEVFLAKRYGATGQAALTYRGVSLEKSSRGLVGTCCDSYVYGVLRSDCHRAGNRANLAAKAVQMARAHA